MAYFFGGLLNAVGQGISMYNLKKGGRALALLIPQLAFILPYIWCLFNGDTFTAAGASVLVVIVVAITYLSLKKAVKRGIMWSLGTAASYSCCRL